MANISGNTVRGADILPDGYTRCFVCGPENPVGLKVGDIRLEDGMVRATLASRSDWQGFPGLLHGGIALSVLDEAMGYACRMMRGKWAATAKLEARFRKPMAIGNEYLAEAWVEDSVSMRRFHCSARLLLKSGDVVVETHGLFVPVLSELAAQLDDHRCS